MFRYKFKVEGKIREELKKPLGRLLQGNPKEPSFLEPEIKKCIGQKSPVMLITVGDEVTKLCNEFRIVPQLCIIDFKVARKKVYSSLEDLYILNFRGREKIVYNPAGYITTRLVKAVEKAIRRYLITGKQEIIRVIGEEDLAGVPAVLLASLGSLVLYGQPGEGIVAVEVTEEKKREILEILNE
ncbi:hypothetical protein A2960_04245 [Candidatus Gottesmanbacteria bacterium RIFCSPLOWO2_01_FULL_39_12b]|uniref:DUF359 domain-containing protein n=1 Tax=Candidatus Gottesmanbacteria bacterium RIFCSPLOWO2_01_FULL_39_12b TaxID=1798388 RepID=A0A1F6ASJ8_9BACT|nr:MAG: hypothetical protein A2960_04245 [Candidatus Gottesmanbacteria bacterium RIFCSPLOWO2_01_FULL_39_12b]